MPVVNFESSKPTGIVRRSGPVERDNGTRLTRSYRQAAKDIHNRTEPLEWTSQADHELPVFLEKFGYGSIEPTTFPKLLSSRVSEYPDSLALCYQKKIENGYSDTWTEITYLELWESVCSFAKALISIGFESRDRMLIMGANSPFYTIALLGGIFADGIVAGIPVSSNYNLSEYYCSFLDATVVLVDNDVNLDKIIKAQNSGKCPKLKCIINWGEIGNPISNCDVHTFTSFCDRSNFVSDLLLSSRLDMIHPGSSCIIVFTSGTTSLPKAAMISHDNAIWQSKTSADPAAFSHQQRLLTFMPFSHIAAIQFDIVIPLVHGLQVYFARPDALKGSILQTLLDVRPHHVFAVPRFWQKLEMAIRTKLSTLSSTKQMIIQNGMACAEESIIDYLENGTPYSTKFYMYRKFILDKITAQVGLDCAQVLISGGAPLAIETQKFYCSLAMPLSEGYGLTETSGCVNLKTAMMGRFGIGSAGVTVEGVEVTIDKKDDSGVGEICFRGRGCFMGYYKNPEQTALIYDQYGYLHTGDMGYIDSQERLYITGRLKELIVNSGGENISPLLIENDLLNAFKPLVDTIVVVGDDKPYLSALITPNAIDTSDGLVLGPGLKEWAEEMGAPSDISELVLFPAYTQEIQKRLDSVNKKAIAQYFKVQKFQVLPKIFSVDTGELTHTMKIKRKEVYSLYSEIIESFYSQ